MKFHWFKILSYHFFLVCRYNDSKTTGRRSFHINTCIVRRKQMYVGWYTAYISMQYTHALCAAKKCIQFSRQIRTHTHAHTYRQIQINRNLQIHCINSNQIFHSISVYVNNKNMFVAMSVLQKNKKHAHTVYIGSQYKNFIIEFV